MATKYNNHHKPPTPNDPCPDPYHVHNIHGFRGESCADKCSDQLPLFSPVGRGIKGDSFKIEIESDSHNATYLAGYSKDEATKEWSKVWTSPNINGGCLNYEYTPYPEEGYFTITFIYTRPDREECEWSWTTPKIPYLGNDVFITYERLAKILSIPISQLKWLTENKESQEGTEDDTGIHNTENDLLDWIDNNDEALGDAINDEQTARQDADKVLSDAIDNIKSCECDEEALKKEILNHIHNDLGFDLDSELTDGNGMTVKEYIDSVVTSTVTNEITNNIINYIYGEKLTCFIKEDFTIDAKKTGWAGQYIPFSSDKDTIVGGSDRLYVTNDSYGNPTACVSNTSSSALHILIAGQIAAQTEDDAYGISFGIHQRTNYNTLQASSDDPYIDIAQAQAIGEANSLSYITALTTPIVCEVPAKTSCYFDLTARPISPDDTAGKCIITSMQTRTYLTITIV